MKPSVVTRCCSPNYSRFPHIHSSSLSQTSINLNTDALQCRNSMPTSSFPQSKSCNNVTRRRGTFLRTLASSSADAPSEALRRILESPGVYQGPACFDALSAKLVEKAGFQYCYTSGFSISAARLGLPDTGYISYGEMLDQGLQITQAVSIPVIGDGDNGYGNAMNVKRTVKGYIKAGFAGIILEDQVSPKACGHTFGRKVVPREEAVMRIKAAISARKQSGSDIVIVARTDSRQAVSLEEALLRSRAFADAGADVLFIDALASREEMEAFCQVSPSVPKMKCGILEPNKMLEPEILAHILNGFHEPIALSLSTDFIYANMLEGGGKTPILNPVELEDIGYKLVVYPLSLIGVSIRAMQDALSAIRGGRIPSPGSMPTFEEIKETLGFNDYYEEEKQYATQLSFQRGDLSKGSNAYSIQQRAQDNAEPRGQSSQDPVVEVITPDVYTNYGADDLRDRFSSMWSRKLRVKITGKDGFEKLDVRIPAGFLDGIKNIVPALGGINIKAMLDDAAEEVGGKLLLDFSDRMGDRIQIFLE